MNREDIIRMAREAGFGDGLVDFVGLQIFQRFATLVAAAEREACAKVCDVTVFGDEYATALINSYADVIRTREQA